MRCTKRYDAKVMDQARSNGYGTILRKPRDLPNDLQEKISDIIGKTPRAIYA